MDRRTFIKTAGSSVVGAAVIARPHQTQAEEAATCLYGEGAYGADVYNGSDCSVPTQVALKDSAAFSQTNWLAGVSALALGSLSWVIWRRGVQVRELD